jgi:DNA-binding NarL/FixJ family response regulator
MIFVYSKDKNIKNNLKNNILSGIEIEEIDEDFFKYDENVTNGNILILDIDIFQNLDNVLLYLNSLPKNIKVIAITQEPKMAQGAYLIKKGIKSYLGKDTQDIVVQDAIKTVQDGNVWLYPELMNYIIKHIEIDQEDTTQSNLLDRLTPKERQIASLVANGLSNKDIAKELDIQLVTVKKHLGHIFEKLDIKDRLSLALIVNS